MRRLWIAFASVASLASCTDSSDDVSNSAADLKAAAVLPVLPAFDPSVAFDPTAETAMSLGSMVADGSRLIPRTTALLMTQW